MKLSQNPFVTGASALFALLVVAAAVGIEPAFAGPSCEKNPTHPKCDDGAPPPPDGCTDTFPGFVYYVEATRKTAKQIALSSSDGCRTEPVREVPNMRNGPRMYATSDGSEGTLVWSEEPGNGAQYVVQRQDFTVDAQGALKLVGLPVQILSQPDTLPDQWFYFSVDIWGGPTAEDPRYLTAFRIVFDDDGNETREFLIYNLDDLSERRVLYSSVAENGTDIIWSSDDCPAVDHPQFVPTCYEMEDALLNPSGTRFYISDNIDDPQGVRWDATLRIDVDMTTGSGALAEWTIGAPAIVFTGPESELPFGLMARPAADRFALPVPEIISFTYLDRSGNQTERHHEFLDADECVWKYAQYTDGDNGGDSDLWMDCIGLTGLYVFDNLVHSWQSPDAALTSKLEKRGRRNIYRQFVSGGMAGIEDLLVENGRSPDTGL